MTDFQLLAKGIALAGCAIGAGAALIVTGLLLIFVAPGTFMNYLS